MWNVMQKGPIFALFVSSLWLLLFLFSESYVCRMWVWRFFHIHQHFIPLTKIFYTCTYIGWKEEKRRKNFIIRFVAIFCTLMFILCLMTFFNEKNGWKYMDGKISIVFLISCEKTQKRDGVWCCCCFFL